MELKKFEAPTLAEALKVVKRELGPEAVVLSTKNNKSGWGLMARSSVEVTAAVSPEALERKLAAEKRLTPEQRDGLLKKPTQQVISAYDVLSGSRIERNLKRSEDLLAGMTKNRGPLPQTQQAPAKKATQPLTQRRYVDIRDDESPAEQATLRSVDRAQFSSPAPQIIRPSAQSMAQASSPVLPKIIAELIDAGVQDNLVREAADELKMIMLREHITREDLLRLQMGRILMSRVRVGRSLGERLRNPSTPRVITFLGPTGVGKTTTIAKIAAELVLNQKRPVTLATTDTYKIAAVEQLQTYANILRIPLEVCPNAEAFANLGSQLGPDDVVLVDTAGFGPRDDRKIVELKEILSSMRTETHLCVASTTRDQDLINCVRRFKAFEPDYLVVTKLDETNMFGNIFNVAATTHIPLSYFTMGQRVPEDMEVATKERVADLLMNLAGGESTWTKQID